jgi:hypothetical protein
MSKHKLSSILSLHVIILVGGSQSVEADTRYGQQAQSSWQTGLSGYIQILAGGYSEDGLSNVTDGNERIASLSGGASNQETDFFAPMWQVSYRLPQSRTRLFIGTPEHGNVVNDIAIEAGVSRELGDGTALWVAYVPGLSQYGSEVWKDPYQTGLRRRRTEMKSESLRIGSDLVIGSPLSVNFEYGKLDVNKEQSGKSLSSRLSAKEIGLLRRSGKFRKAELSVALPFSERVLLVPEVSFMEMDAKGGASSYDAVAAGFVATYADGPLEIFIYSQLSKNKYDQPNPVFNTKREDKHYSITAGVSYMEPFGLKDMQADLIVGHGFSDSTIDFFESNSKLLAIGCTWRY